MAVTATEKLYLNDSFLFSFDAEVLGPSEYDGKPSLILNRSAFYGESGGQLGDRGLLRAGQHEIRVIDTQIDDEQQIHHIPENPADTMLAGVVSGAVDEAHRRDMMSQHTGQHMLSAAFYKVAGMETASARLGSESSTIDLQTPDVTDKVIHAVEDMVNSLVLENRAIKPLYPNTEELAALALRRSPKVTENIRLIEVSDYDITPCGGTHCVHTGQVGPVRITGLERYKGLTRVTFLAGMRALRFLRRRDELLRNTARELGCGAPEILDVFASLRKELRDQSQALGKSRAELTGHLVRALHEAHPPENEFTPILALRPEDDLTSVRKLAAALAGRADVLAIAAGRDSKSGDWAVTIERGAAVDLHVGNWFREKSKELGGRGGGRPERAEGRWPSDVDWDAFNVT